MAGAQGKHRTMQELAGRCCRDNAPKCLGGGAQPLKLEAGCSFCSTAPQQANRPGMGTPAPKGMWQGNSRELMDINWYLECFWEFVNLHKHLNGPVSEDFQHSSNPYFRPPDRVPFPKSLNWCITLPVCLLAYGLAITL